MDADSYFNYVYDASTPVKAKLDEANIVKIGGKDTSSEKNINEDILTFKSYNEFDYRTSGKLNEKDTPTNTPEKIQILRNKNRSLSSQIHGKVPLQSTSLDMPEVDLPVDDDMHAVTMKDTKKRVKDIQINPYFDVHDKSQKSTKSILSVKSQVTDAIPAAQSELKLNLQELERLKIQPTRADFESLELSELVKYNKNGFWKVLCFQFYKHTSITGTFFYFTFLNPLFYRIVIFATEIILTFSLNALFFDQNIIQVRFNIETDKLGMGYTIKNEFSKSLWSLILSYGLALIFKPFISLNLQSRKEFNRALTTVNSQQIYESYRKMLIANRVKMIIFYVIALTINLICLYFCTIFYVVFENSFFGWIEGCFISLAASILLIEPIVPILKTVIIQFAFKFQNSKVWKFLFKNLA